MGRKGIKVHSWTKEDEKKLQEAIKDALPLQEHYKRQGYGLGNWWDSVAGRMAPEILVTGKACKERAKALFMELVKAGEKEKKWSEVVEKVETYEQDYNDYLLDRVHSLEKIVVDTNKKLSIVCKELGVEVC